MRKFIVLAVLAVMSLFAVMPVMGQDTPGTIADIVVASATGETPEFATLLTAVQAADPAVLEALSNPDASLTVFAPTDAAFAALAEALGADAFAAVLADQEMLTSILLFHVVEGKVMSADVVAGLGSAVTMQEAMGVMNASLPVKTLNGQSIEITQDEMGDVFVNAAKLNLDMVDIEASNGVIHVIDAVMLPESRTIAEIVTDFTTAETPEFTTLLTAVAAADPSVLELLSDPEAGVTVFAPTDAAFAALSEALGADAFAAIVADPEALTPILTYHVLPGVVSSSDLAGAASMDTSMEMPAWLSEVAEDGSLVLNTANGATLTFKVAEDGIYLNDTVKIVMVDVDASNGIIHVIDTVLVPAE